MRTKFARCINSRLNTISSRSVHKSDKVDCETIARFARAAFLLKLISEDELNEIWVCIKNVLNKQFANFHPSKTYAQPDNILLYFNARYEECLEAAQSEMDYLRFPTKTHTSYLTITAEQCEYWIQMSAIIAEIARITEIWSSDQCKTAELKSLEMHMLLRSLTTNLNLTN